MAIRCIKKYARDHFDISIDTIEFTINQSFDYILGEIYRSAPKILAFSCYIWNIELVTKLANSLNKILPETVIVFGGPQASYDYSEVLNNNCCDIVCLGEGEVTIPMLIKAIENGDDLSQVIGISYKAGEEILTSGFREFIEMDSLGGIYEDISEFDNKIIYYETSRGCPFSCAYCLSSAHSGVRFMSMDIVKSQLDLFLKEKALQIKFVDRTFNCNKAHALSIWEYIIENDNGYTNFHFEIAADLLDDDMLELLKKARLGLFQLEIGVQSTNENTLYAICRKMDLSRVYKVVNTLISYGNMHLHLDLIAGLPLENYESFKKSFNDIYALSGQMLQLGFLKLLHGSALFSQKDKYEIVCNEHAPFEVLYTADISYTQILRLKAIEHLVDMYYNSNRFKRSLKFLVEQHKTAFDFFESFAVYFAENRLNEISHNNMKLYKILHDYFESVSKDVSQREIYAHILKADMYSHEKVKVIPEFLGEGNDEEQKSNMFDFFSQPENIEKYLPEYVGLHTKQIYRQAHIQTYPFDVDDVNNKTATTILYNYKKIDLCGNCIERKIML